MVKAVVVAGRDGDRGEHFVVHLGGQGKRTLTWKGTDSDGAVKGH